MPYNSEKKKRVYRKLFRKNNPDYWKKNYKVLFVPKKLHQKIKVRATKKKLTIISYLTYLTK